VTDRAALRLPAAHGRGYSPRAIQIALGLLWLLDGALQFQPSMYSHRFIDMITGTAAGQPAWVASSMTWAAHLVQRDLPVFNTFFALVQVLIGLGLLYRPTVKLALALSLPWALVVWWVGEGFGMLFTDTANPLTGAPGAVVLYAIVALIVWPTPQPGGVLGVQRARMAWGALWLLMAWLWLLESSSSADATSSAIAAAPSGMGWLRAVQDWTASATKGNGLVIAFALAAASAAIGLAVAANRRPRPFLALAIVLNLGYWVLGQGLGGVFAGGATDPNAAPLFVLLALALYALTPASERPTADAGLVPARGGARMRGAPPRAVSAR
jgi:hypothetical protein